MEQSTMGKASPQVSVIVLTYNPDPLKLRRTLSAAAAQQDVALEIIVSDDGSARKDFSWLTLFMIPLYLLMNFLSSFMFASIVWLFIALFYTYMKPELHNNLPEQEGENYA